MGKSIATEVEVSKVGFMFYSDSAGASKTVCAGVGTSDFEALSPTECLTGPK